MEGPHLLETASLKEFFREQVTTSLEHLKVSASPHAEFYLVCLLTGFSNAENLFERSPHGEVTDKALAIRLFEATLASSHEKIPVLKKMGDVALYTSGFFADSFFTKIVGAEYYIHMGEVAYSSVSQLLSTDSGKNMKELYDELATHFVQFVDVLSDVAEKSHITCDKDLLRLYERWLKTGSNRTRQLLVKEGIIPNNQIPFKYEQ